MDEEEYDYKRIVATPPESIGRQEWINHLCRISPNNADRIRREAIEQVGKMPKVYQTYQEGIPVGIVIAWE